MKKVKRRRRKERIIMKMNQTMKLPSRIKSRMI